MKKINKIKPISFYDQFYDLFYRFLKEKFQNCFDIYYSYFNLHIKPSINNYIMKITSII